MADIEPVHGLVLAGGRARRMHYVDKALVDFRGRPLLAHVLARLQPQVEEIWLNVNRDQHCYAQFGLTLLGDLADFSDRGPLAGIHAGLSFSAANCPGWLLVCPCDSPFLPANLAQRLLAAVSASRSHAAVVHDGQRLHPVFCMLHSDLLATLEDHLRSTSGSVQAWLESVAASVVDFSDAPDNAFANINSPQDLIQMLD